MMSHDQWRLAMFIQQLKNHCQWKWLLTEIFLSVSKIKTMLLKFHLLCPIFSSKIISNEFFLTLNTIQFFEEFFSLSIFWPQWHPWLWRCLYYRIIVVNFIQKTSRSLVSFGPSKQCITERHLNNRGSTVQTCIRHNETKSNYIK